MKQASNHPLVKCIAIASSMGGPQALRKLLPEICRVTTLPIFMVQHMAAGFTNAFAKGLNDFCRDSGYQVYEGASGQPVHHKSAFLAPGGQHMMVIANRIRLNGQSPLENGCRPAADPLLRSLAAGYGSRILTIVLTGMGQDGTNGCAHIKAVGGYVIAQGEASSTIWGMPKSVIMAGLADEVLELDEIAQAVAKLAPGARNALSSLDNIKSGAGR